MNDALNGELGYVFLVSILDAALLSWIALGWYRRSVSRIMQRPADVSDAPQPDRSQLAGGAAPSGNPLKMTVVESGKLPCTTVARLPPTAVWQRLAIAYVVGAVLYSAVMTAAMSASMWPVNPAAIVAQLWGNTWPVLPALIALLVLDRKRGFALVGLFVAVGAIVVPIVGIASQTARGARITSPLSNAFNTLVFLVQLTYVPLLLVALTGWRRIRAVMAPALAATLLFGFGLFVFRRAIASVFDVGVLKTLMLEAAAATSSETIYYGLFLLLALPVGWLTWRAFIQLASAYTGHTFSDIQLIVDCWVVIVTAESTATHLVTEFGLAGVVIGATAFAAYRAGVTVMLRVLPLPTMAEATRDGNRLLLLRVFGYQARTESLFDHIAQRWRFRGPVQLIAGTDLAMRTVDPGDVLAFVGGRLRDQYVSSIDDVPRRIARLDTDRDPDGRFRINELYCLADTWQPTIEALLAMTDVIVMDLRGFTKDRKGAQFELQHIVTRVPTDRIVLISDNTTDEPLVESILQVAWAQPSSHAARRNGNLTLLRVDHNSRRELDGVMSRLVGYGQAQQPSA